jgi:hypothetical protein
MINHVLTITLTTLRMRRGMKPFLLALLLGASGFAQQEASLGGIIELVEGQAPEGTRVAIHIIDRDSVWQREIASALPTAGTFTVITQPVTPEELSPFRSGAVLLPGLQNEYTVSPEDANFAQARVNMYVDANQNGVFDRTSDATYIGIASLENPTGFFSIIYVDKDVTLTGKGATLSLKPGWNVLTFLFPEDAEPIYQVQPTVDNILMSVFLP